jgi:predicted nucleic acid-binding protein
VSETDLRRAIELLEGAAEHRPRLADALLVAAAERLGVHRIATFDRRPIAVLRPRHVRAFDLEP